MTEQVTTSRWMDAMLTCTLALAAIAFSLSACGGGSVRSEPPESPALAQQIETLEKTGQLPQLDRSSDIKGPDADNKGSRDDIDA